MKQKDFREGFVELPNVSLSISLDQGGFTSQLLSISAAGYSTGEALRAAHELLQMALQCQKQRGGHDA